MAATRRTHTQPTATGRNLGSGREAHARHRVDHDQGFRVTDRDLELIEFVAAHRFALACQVKEWMGASEVVAYRRLKGLVEQGLLSYRRVFHARAGCYLATAPGLAVIESPLPRATIDLRTYRHDVGVVWLWLAEANGSFGAERRVLSEREMRSHDQRREPRDESFAIPLGGYTSGGNPRVHYPDVLVIERDGGRVAFELELTLKSRRRLEAILAGYREEPGVEGVVYFTDSEVIAAAVEETSRLVGLDGRVDIEYFAPAPERDIERAWQNRIQGGSDDGS